MASEQRIALVGAGPRGLAVLERICANARDREMRFSVFVIDPHEPGAGAVWRRDQSFELLMNTVASQVSVFTDESVSMVGPVESGPSLFEWASSLAISGQATSTYSRELHLLGPDDYPSRRLYGEYLAYAFRLIVERAPSNVNITTVTDTVERIQPADVSGLSHDLYLMNGALVPHLDHVVMSLGHSPAVPSVTSTAVTAKAAHWQGVLIPPSSPADVDLRGIHGTDHVIVRGLGLNFFDYVALLTTGRGGEFAREGDQIFYRASGREPVLHVGSRRGLPHLARGRNEKGSAGRAEPRLLTQARIDSLKARHRNSPLHFKTDLWPLIDRDVECTYYEHFIPNEVDRQYFVEAYLQANTDDLTAVLEEHQLSDIARWDWAVLARPWQSQVFSSRNDFQEWMRNHLLHDVEQALLGNMSGPVKSALDLLRDLRNEIRSVIDHNGIDGRSYIDDVEGWYTPLNAFLSIGPPLQRVEELVALMDADVVKFIGPDMEVEAGDGGFRAQSGVISQEAVTAKHLIEARLPVMDIRKSSNPLIRSLLRDGLAQLHRFRSGEESIESGGLAVTPRPFNLISTAWPEGHPRLYAYGVPTESVHWVTAAGARPGVDSVTFRDADAISLAIITSKSIEPDEVLERTRQHGTPYAVLAY